MRSSFQTWRTRRCCYVAIFVTIAFIISAVVVGIAFGLRHKHEKSGAPPPPSATAPFNPGNRTISPNGTWWKPTPRTTWQIVLNETIEPTGFENVAVYDIDLFNTPSSTIDALHAAGIRVICYFSAGSYENWRPDANKFPKSVLGTPLDGWPGERWLNVSSSDVRTIMTSRIELAYNKSCDGLDPDNIDGYSNDNGLGLTEEDAVDYVKFLVQQGHSRGMAVGLKNAGEIVPNVTQIVDWEVNEQCVQYDECDTFEPFISADKPVFHIEYPNNTNLVSIQTICSESPSNFSTLLKHMELDEWDVACWNVTS